MLSKSIGNNNRTCFKKYRQHQLCLPILCDHYFLRYAKTNLYSSYHRPLKLPRIFHVISVNVEHTKMGGTDNCPPDNCHLGQLPPLPIMLVNW